jgi:hypothetical protein
MKQKAYISGKITGLEKKLVRMSFYNYSFFLKQKDYEVVNPLQIKPFLGIKKYWYYMINDIRALRKCDKVFFMPNWTDSRGAVIEYFFAKFIFKKKVEILK